MARVLIEHGANLNAKDGKGQTPLWLSSTKQRDSFQITLEYGAK
jgi:ankyrin repeat protein